MKSLAIVAPLFVLASCGQDVSFQPNPAEPTEGQPRSLEPRIQTDVVLQAAIPEVDILWTIDNSGSMNCIVGCHGGPGGDTDFVRVTDEFDSFMSFLDGSGLDYHIGVITADPLDEGALVRQGNIRWIDDGTPNPVETFRSIALGVGTSGSDVETGVGTTFQAREDQFNDENAGFFRPDASLHTVVFANEDDQTPDSLVTLNEFTRWYRGLRVAVEERTFNSIVCTEIDGFGFDGPCREVSERYMQATEDIGGITWDITSEDYGSLIERLGTQAVAQRAEYFLSEIPIVDTIRVEMIVEDGPQVVLLPRTVNPETGEAEGVYTYVPVRNSILFEDYRPPALARLEISYVVAGDFPPLPVE